MQKNLYKDLLENEPYTYKNSKKDLEIYFGTDNIDQVNEQFYNNIYEIGKR